MFTRKEHAHTEVDLEINYNSFPFSACKTNEKLVSTVYLRSPRSKALPRCVCCSVEMLLQDIASLKQAFRLSIVLLQIYTAGERGDPLLIFLLIFHHKSPKSEGVQFVRTDSIEKAKTATTPTD